MNIVGINVTIPHKEAVIPLLDKLDSSAQRARAINTIVNESGMLVGYNTDGAGLCYALEQEATFDCQQKKMVIIGAGGSAKAIASAFTALKPGGQIMILDLSQHTFEKARELYGDCWLGFPESDLHRWLEQAGFKKIEISIVAREEQPPHFQTVLASAEKTR